MFAYRRCGQAGLWLGRKIGEENAQGWTNYTPCFPSEVQILFFKVYDHDNDDLAKVSTKYVIIHGIRINLYVKVYIMLRYICKGLLERYTNKWYFSYTICPLYESYLADFTLILWENIDILNWNIVKRAFEIYCILKKYKE